MVLIDRSITSSAKDEEDNVDEDDDEELRTQDMRRVNHRMTAIKHHPGKWGVRCCFTKEDNAEMLKDTANAFDFLK